MALSQLPINVFDLVALAVLILGILRGRKHGMSSELMLLIKWLAVVLGCGFAYLPLGQQLAQLTSLNLLTCFLFVYVGMAVAILGLFALLKHHLGGNLAGSDAFGRAEYYLGMGSGGVRVACILLVVLAVLNARYFSPLEVRAMEQKQDELYGSNYFPTWQNAQAMVFEKSLSGPWIRDHLGFLLIKPTAPVAQEAHQREFNLP